LRFENRFRGGSAPQIAQDDLVVRGGRLSVAVEVLMIQLNLKPCFFAAYCLHDGLQSGKYFISVVFCAFKRDSWIGDFDPRNADKVDRKMIRRNYSMIESKYLGPHIDSNQMDIVHADPMRARQ
jgi:hypothetical protein